MLFSLELQHTNFNMNTHTREHLFFLVDSAILVRLTKAINNREPPYLFQNEIEY